MEMPEIWQEGLLSLCFMARGSWIVHLWFGTQKNNKKITKSEISAFFDTHDFNPSVSPYNNANGFKICHHLPKS